MSQGCPRAIAPRSRFYFPFPLGSLIGTYGDELTILGLPSEWVWPRIRDSKSRKNFSASMMRPGQRRLLWIRRGRIDAIQSLRRERRLIRPKAIGLAFAFSARSRPISRTEGVARLQ